MNRKIFKTKFRFVILLLVLMLIIITVLLYKRYGFTRERADLNKYLGVAGDKVAIYLNDVQVSIDENNEKVEGVAVNDSVYLPLTFIKKFLNNRFYYAKDIDKVLYCLPDEIKSVGIGDIHQVGNSQSVIMKTEPYILVDYVKDFTNMRYDKYIDNLNNRIYIYTDWDKENIAYIKGKESARLQGGNKSKVITVLKRGEEVKVLEKMTKWIKVKTADGYIGYIRKTKINNETERIPLSDYIERVKPQLKMNKKPCLGFHQVLSNYSSSRLPELLKNSKGMNVIAPTWFCIKDNNGEIRSIANDAYSLYCHSKGYEVWATVNNFDVANVDEKIIFSSNKIRRKMIDKILREVNVNNLDGINLDIEDVSVDAGEDYVEFVRELSIELSKVGCKLSIDTYVPYNFNKHYDLKEFNDFCDYVIIMAYDEHYSGSKEAGSVSSINYVRDAINHSLVDVDKDKLIIALPFYSRIWTTGTDGKVTSIAQGSQAIEYAAINQGLTFSFDEVTCQDYGTKTTQDGALVECWLENDLSLAYKMMELKKAGVAGSAAWKLTQERENFFNIINMNK